jgi:hypothetical protein
MPDQAHEPAAFAVQEHHEDQADQSFAVCDEKTANWVIRKILEARAYADRTKFWAEAEQRRAQRQEAFFLERYGGQLETWLREELARRGGRSRSIPLPAGRIGLRRSQPRLQIIDPSAAMDWARAHCPTAIRLSESLIKTPLNEHLHQTGELPAGTNLQPERDDLYVS